MVAIPLVQKAPEFVELSLAAPTSLQAEVAAPSESIQIELKRGSLGVNVLWPLSAAGDCAVWLRELLR